MVCNKNVQNLGSTKNRRAFSHLSGWAVYSVELSCHSHVGMDPQLRWPVIQLCSLCLSCSNRLGCSYSLGNSTGASKWVQTARHFYCPLWAQVSHRGWRKKEAYAASLERETAGTMEADAWGQGKEFGPWKGSICHNTQGIGKLNRQVWNMNKWIWTRDKWETQEMKR